MLLAMPKKRKKGQGLTLIQIRVLPKEREQLAKAATLASLPVATYIRTRMLTIARKEIRDGTDDKTA